MSIHLDFSRGLGGFASLFLNLACTLLLVGPLVLSSSCMAPAGSQGKLEGMRREVTNNKTSRSPRHHRPVAKSTRRQDSSPNDSNDDLSELGQELVFLILATPFAIPVVALEDDYDHLVFFPDHPYEEHHQGYLLKSRTIQNLDKARTWAMQFSLENGADFDDDINRLGGLVLFSTNSRFGGLLQLHHLSEEFENRYDDDLLLGDINVVFRFAESDRAQFRVGVGMRFLADDDLYKGGINFLYGMDLHPCKPLVITAQVDGGALGGAGVFHSRCTVGLAHEDWEFFLGYDHLQVGSNRIHGPMAGIRFYF